ncbi:uncharacterized protein LOC110851149 [Folsomia candida]|uniref:Protein abrupt n=1 Tax=Folsomia candida TaxID=158441 RepID=A0A226E5Q4_FOLCA|nr:uncharacterized protein LOC110851149 [Folsomia candida]OXA52769.1 Protein abrupt [Folsomia candida]
MNLPDVEKGILLGPKRLQAILNKSKPEIDAALRGFVHPILRNLPNPEKKKMCQIKGKYDARDYIFKNQKARAKNAECDMFILCDEGSIPCHRVFVSLMSPLLRSLIDENIEAIGVPGCKNPISIYLSDCSIEDLRVAMSFFYTGFVSFSSSRRKAVLDILEFFQVDKSATSNVEPYSPTLLQEKKCKLLQVTIDGGSSSDSSESEESGANEDDTPSRSGERKKRTGKWVKETTSKTSSSVTSRESKAPPKSNSSSSISLSKSPSVGRKTRNKSNYSVTPSPATTPNKPISRQSNSIENTPRSTRSTSAGVVAGTSVTQGSSKNVPGSLTTRQPEPRVKKVLGPPRTTLNATIRRTRSSKKAPPKITAGSDKPTASTSAVLGVMDQPPRSKVPYEHDSEYEPSEMGPIVSSSSPSVFSEQGSDEDDLEEKLAYAERNLRSRAHKEDMSASASNHADEIDLNHDPPTLSLVDRLKLNPRHLSGNEDDHNGARYPKRARKKVEHYLPEPAESVVNVESDESGNGGNRDDSDDVESNVSSKDTKCYFCKTAFDTEEDLARHSTSECGKHLKHMYNFADRQCLNCFNIFGPITHYELVKHVQYCISDNKSITDAMSASGIGKHKLKSNSDLEEPLEKRAKTTPISPSMTTNGQEKNTQILTKNGQKFAIGKSKVVMQRFSDELVKEVINEIRNKRTPDIQRVPGYNYVRRLVTPKTEIPDLFPDDTPEMNAERIRQYRKEQEEYIIQSEMRKLIKLQAEQAEKDAAEAKKVVNPVALHLHRCMDMQNQKTVLNAKAIFEKFRNCSCGDVHSDIEKSLKCLKKRKLSKCWICCTEFEPSHPMEHHLRKLHSSNTGRVNCVTCPVCKASLTFAELNQHVYTHFKGRSSYSDDDDEEVFETNNAVSVEGDVLQETDNTVSVERVVLQETDNNIASVEGEVLQETNNAASVEGVVLQETDNNIVSVEGDVLQETENIVSVEGDVLQETENIVSVEGDVLQETENIVSVEGDILQETENIVSVEGDVLQETENIVSVEGDVLHETDSTVSVEGNVLHETGNSQNNDRQRSEDNLQQGTADNLQHGPGNDSPQGPEDNLQHGPGNDSPQGPEDNLQHGPGNDSPQEPEDNLQQGTEIDLQQVPGNSDQHFATELCNNSSANNRNELECDSVPPPPSVEVLTAKKSATVSQEKITPPVCSDDVTCPNLDTRISKSVKEVANVRSDIGEVVVDGQHLRIIPRGVSETPYPGTVHTMPVSDELINLYSSSNRQTNPPQNVNIQFPNNVQQQQVALVNRSMLFASGAQTQQQQRPMISQAGGVHVNMPIPARNSHPITATFQQQQQQQPLSAPVNRNNSSILFTGGPSVSQMQPRLQIQQQQEHVMIQFGGTNISMPTPARNAPPITVYQQQQQQFSVRNSPPITATFQQQPQAASVNRNAPSILYATGPTGYQQRQQYPMITQVGGTSVMAIRMRNSPPITSTFQQQPQRRRFTAPPPPIPVAKYSCNKCNRLFISKDLFDTHFC